MHTAGYAAEIAADHRDISAPGWIEASPIPADQSSWSVLGMMGERNTRRLRTILEEVRTNSSARPEQMTSSQRLGIVYDSCLAPEWADDGLLPLQRLFELVDGMSSIEEVFSTIATLTLAGHMVLIGGAVGADIGNPNKNIFSVWQGSGGLPDASYYLKNDSKSRELRQAYRDHVATMLDLLSMPDPEVAAEHVLRLETRLAQISMPAELLRDPDATYNKLDLTGLEELSPELPWDRYLQVLSDARFCDPAWKIGRDAACLPPAFGRASSPLCSAGDCATLEEIDVSTPEFFEKLQAVLRDTPLEHIKSLFRWRLVVAAVTGAANGVS